jgi:hypothetical protein
MDQECISVGRKRLVNVRLSDDAWRTLKVACAQRGLSMRAVILQALGEWMERQGVPWG